LACGGKRAAPAAPKVRSGMVGGSRWIIAPVAGGLTVFKVVCASIRSLQCPFIAFTFHRPAGGAARKTARARRQAAVAPVPAADLPSNCHDAADNPLTAAFRSFSLPDCRAAYACRSCLSASNQCFCSQPASCPRESQIS
jgi:hypothetical protein